MFKLGELERTYAAYLGRGKGKITLDYKNEDEEDGQEFYRVDLPCKLGGPGGDNINLLFDEAELTVTLLDDDDEDKYTLDFDLVKERVLDDIENERLRSEVKKDANI